MISLGIDDAKEILRSSIIEGLVSKKQWATLVDVIQWNSIHEIRCELGYILLEGESKVFLIVENGGKYIIPKVATEVVLPPEKEGSNE